MNQTDQRLPKLPIVVCTKQGGISIVKQKKIQEKGKKNTTVIFGSPQFCAYRQIIPAASGQSSRLVVGFYALFANKPTGSNYSSV